MIMHRDAMLGISEFFFWILGGVPLVNSIWIFPYVFLASVLMIIPFYLAVTYGKNKIKSLPAIIFIVSFYPLLIIDIGPPIVQMQMMQECETVQHVISTDLVENHIMDIRQCRIKENYYGDFGEWSIGGNG
jgi:hypothetical protein